MRFLRDVAVAFAARMGVRLSSEPDIEPAAALREAIDPLAILAHASEASENLTEFRQGAFHAVARQHLSVLMGDDTAELDAALREVLQEWINNSFDEDAEVIYPEEPEEGEAATAAVTNPLRAASLLAEEEQRDLLAWALKLFPRPEHPDWTDADHVVAVRAALLTLRLELTDDKPRRAVALVRGPLASASNWDVPLGVVGTRTKLEFGRGLVYSNEGQLLRIATNFLETALQEMLVIHMRASEAVWQKRIWECRLLLARAHMAVMKGAKKIDEKKAAKEDAASQIQKFWSAVNAARERDPSDLRYLKATALLVQGHLAAEDVPLRKPARSLGRDGAEFDDELRSSYSLERSAVYYYKRGLAIFDEGTEVADGNKQSPETRELKAELLWGVGVSDDAPDAMTDALLLLYQGLKNRPTEWHAVNVAQMLQQLMKHRRFDRSAIPELEAVLDDIVSALPEPASEEPTEAEELRQWAKDQRLKLESGVDKLC
jgi:hypothetical protein